MPPSLLRALVTALLLMLVGASPALAKTPPFSMTVSTTTPAPAGPVVVEVMFDQDFLDFPADDLHEVLGLFSTADVDDNGRPRRTDDFTPVQLQRVEAGVYRGALDAPSELGDYVLLPFPNVMDELETDAYPEPLLISVQGAGAPLGPALIGLLVVTGLGFLTAPRWRRREGATT